MPRPTRVVRVRRLLNALGFGLASRSLLERADTGDLKQVLRELGPGALRTTIEKELRRRGTLRDNRYWGLR